MSDLRTVAERQSFTCGHCGHTRHRDDLTPVDEDWLRPLCVRVSDLESYWTIADIQHTSIYVVRWSYKPFRWHLKVSDVTVSENATRGDVRRICSALGVPLKETGE